VSIAYFVEVALSDKPTATRTFYAQKCRHLLRIFGNVDVATIRKADAMAFAQQRLAEGAHRHTVGKELIALRRVLTTEHDRSPLPVPPRDLIPRWKMEYRPRSRHLTPHEFERLLETMPAKRRLFLVVAVYTGACLGELERLEWAHVDTVKGLVHLPGTKATNRRRTVPLAAPLRPWVALPAGRRTGRVLPKWKNVTRDLARYCARIRIPKVSANDLRRTYASWLVDAGVPHLTVAHLLGHSSTRMVEAVYGRLNRDHYAAAVSKLPDCTTGVQDTVPRVSPGGAPGTAGHLYNDANTPDFRVPRDGVEPPTRGFSVRPSPEPESSTMTRRSAAAGRR
jgi:integrase